MALINLCRDRLRGAQKHSSTRDHATYPGHKGPFINAICTGAKSDNCTYRLRECHNGEAVGLVKNFADSIYGCSPSGILLGRRRTHLVRDGRRVVLAPLRDERLLLLARRRELEVARLLRDDGALVHRLQVGRQLGPVLAHLKSKQSAESKQTTDIIKMSHWHTFCGLRSHTSSGTSTVLVTFLSWHSSGPSSVTHPAPQICRSTGNSRELCHTS